MITLTRDDLTFILEQMMSSLDNQREFAESRKDAEHIEEEFLPIINKLEAMIEEMK